jgi:hypothetical protein
MSTLPRRIASTRPGTPERRIRAQLQRVAVVVVEAAQDRMHALQARERLEPDASVAHREVAPFDERQPEVASEVRMLEIGFVQRSRRQQHGQRAACAVARRPVREGVAQRREEAREVLDLLVAEQLGKRARDDDAVFQCIAGA